MKEKYKTTFTLGVVPMKRNKFNDCKLFKDKSYENQSLKKVKVWWGTERTKNIKTLLGIQCVYKNVQTGEETTSEPHCGEISSDDITVKELTLKDKDYINNIKIGFDNSDIKLIGFKTKRGESLEFGKGKSKNIEMNKGDNAAQCFYGYYNELGIKALGCKYITRKDFIFLNLQNLFRIRHLFLVNDEKRKKWEDKLKLKLEDSDKDDKENNKDIDIVQRAIAKLCLLPSKPYFCIVKYLI